MNPDPDPYKMQQAAYDIRYQLLDITSRYNHTDTTTALLATLDLLISQLEDFYINDPVCKQHTLQSLRNKHHQNQNPETQDDR